MASLLSNTRAVKYLTLTNRLIPFNIWIELTDIKKDYLEISKLKKDTCVVGYNPDLIRYNKKHFLSIKCVSLPALSTYLYNKSYREENMSQSLTTQLSREQSQQIIHAYYEAFFALFYGGNEVSCGCF